MKLLELFDRPSEYKWNHAMPSFKSARFTTPNGQNIHVQFIQRADGEWNVQFENRNVKPGEEQKITGTEEQYVIFSTVLAVMNDFIQQHNPELLHIEAQEPSRQRLYDRMVKALGTDWNVRTYTHLGYKHYELTRKQ